MPTSTDCASDSDPDCIVNELPASAANEQDLPHSRRRICRCADHVSLPTFGFILPNSVDAAWSEQDNEQVLVFRDGIISRSICINDEYSFDRDRVLLVRMRFETLPRKQPRKRHRLAPRAWSSDALDLCATPA